jgi:hypothetical protein
MLRLFFGTSLMGAVVRNDIIESIRQLIKYCNAETLSRTNVI